MSPGIKRLIYVLSPVLFLTSVTGMLFYGYKTFYIEAQQVENQQYDYHFALVGEEKDNAYWRLIEQGAKQAAADNNVYLEYVAPQKANNVDMLTLLDRMISAKVDGIIIQGISGDRFVDLVHKGIERGIPIITVDTDVQSSERKAYVGTDNREAGKILGRAIINHTTGEQQVGVVTGRFDAINQQERIAGFKETIAAVPRIQIVDIKASNLTTIGATQATYSLLKRYPEITSLVGTSALDGVGIVEGIHEIAPNKAIYIAAFDRLPATLNLIRQDELNATIAQYPEEMGTLALEAMMNLKSGQLTDRLILTETGIIQKEDLPADEQDGEGV